VEIDTKRIELDLHIDNYIPCLLSVTKLIKYREHGNIYHPYKDLTITLEDIKTIVAETTDVCDSDNVLLWDKKIHIGRIQFFINNPKFLKDIYVQAGKENCFIEDGNHRFMAACALNIPVISGWVIGNKQTIERIIKGGK